ncbi:hypothetical protein [Paraburkholderia lycopersici]|uniref:Uncharacterized protein n=1 Tax=Paraburkholderia lycopersici TaxID=416944 RepID=A0A1G6I5F4_9BURK|nr:hypothetical protein [Paraburkholderia lycopersici]SDC01724.1 hypothetical protein SAMN05421548_103265 [Paraburkholderia lycopersici]
MKSFIERQLFQPALVLPMVDLMQLMVSLDFNMGQIGLMVATRGARAAYQRSRELWNGGHGESAPADCVH